MPLPPRIKRSFFNQNTVAVARQLLGMRLVHLENGVRISGIITETEAYRGEEDLACHARAGRTPRTTLMYGPPGYAYVYYNYGMHWLLNFVTEAEGFPAAVLIRGMAPSEGIDIIAQRRKDRPRPQWTNGPAKICQALGVDGAFNGLDSCAPKTDLFIEKCVPIPDSGVTIGPRVGLNKVSEPWKSMPWRFRVTNDSQILVQEV